MGWYFDLTQDLTTKSATPVSPKYVTEQAVRLVDPGHGPTNRAPGERDYRPLWFSEFRLPCPRTSSEVR